MLSSLLKLTIGFTRGAEFHSLSYGDKTGRFFLSSGGVIARSKAINYLHLVAETVERHDRNSGRRPVESSLFWP